MERFVRFVDGKVIDLNKVKLSYSVHENSISAGSMTNESIGQGDTVIWIQDITLLIAHSNNPLDLLNPKVDMIEYRAVGGNRIRRYECFVKPKNDKQAIDWKYQLDGAQCLKRHIRAIWFRVGDTFERLELELNKK